MNGFYDYQAYSGNPQRGGLEAMLGSLFQSAHLGGMGGGGAMTSMGMVEYNMRMANSRALLESVNRNDIRSAGLTSRVLDSFAGAGEAARLSNSAGAGYVNTLTGTLLNNHNLGIGGFFGGYLPSATAGYQSGLGMGGVSLDGRAILGQGSGNANITSRLVTDMQNRMFTANGTISKTGFSYDELGSIVSRIGEGGGFRGAQFKSHFHGGTGQMAIEERGIKEFNDRFIEPTVKAVQALKDVFGPGSSSEDLAAAMKSITGLNMGNAGSASLLTSRTTGLRLAAAGAGLDERHVMSLQNEMMAHYASQGYAQSNSSAAGTYVAMQVADAIGASGRSDLQGQFKRQAGSIAGMAFERGGQYDMLALATYATRTGAGDAKTRAAAQQFIDETRTNGTAAYDSRRGSSLFTELHSLASRNGGLEAIMTNMGGAAKGDLDTLMKGALGSTAKSIFQNARDNYDLGALGGSRADLQNLIEAVGSADALKVISGEDKLADFTDAERTRLGQVAGRLRTATAGMSAEDLLSVTSGFEAQGGFALSGNARRKQSAVRNQINKLAAIVPGDAGRTGVQDFIAGILKDGAVSEDEAMNSAAMLLANDGYIAGVQHFDLSKLSDEEKLAKLQSLHASGLRTTRRQVRGTDGKFVDSPDEYVAIAADKVKNMQARGDRVKLLNHLGVLGAGISTKGSVHGMLEGGNDFIDSYLTADALGKLAVGAGASEGSFAALVAAMDPTERLKLKDNLENQQVTIGGVTMNPFEAAASVHMTQAEFSKKWGTIEKPNMDAVRRDAAASDLVRKARIVDDTKGGSFLGTLRLENGFNMVIDLFKKIGDEKNADPGATGSNSKP